MPTTFTSATFTSALALATIKSAVILVAAVLGAQLLRRRSATLRHAVWTAALTSTIAVLALPGVTPLWRGIPVVPSALVLAPSSVSIHESAAVRDAGPVDAASLSAASSHAVSNTPMPWVTIIMCAWLVGAAVVVLRNLSGRAALSRLARGASESPGMSGLAQRLARAMGITRAVRVVVSERTDIALTWGIVSPTIALPAETAEWTDECRDHVLQHELAHVKRHDAVTQIVAEVACAAFWFNPLVWHAVREMRRERERACDDYVITHGAVASQYAGDLLALVVGADPRAYGSALAFGRRSQLEGRLSALLDATLDRGALGARQIVAVAGASALIVAPTAALRAVDARPTLTIVHEAPPAQVPVRAAEVAVPAPRVPAQAPRLAPPLLKAMPDTVAQVAPRRPAILDDVFTPCGPSMSSHMHSDAESNANDATWTASGDINGCTFSLKAVGVVLVDASATGLDRLAPSATFDVTTNIHGAVTRLTVHASEAGVLSYAFSRNGQAAEFSDGGRAWLAQFLLGLERTTALATERRLPLLLKGGVTGVLDEIDHLHSDYARVVYATLLIAKAPLDADAVHRVAAIGLAVSSDHQAGDVAGSLAAKYTLSTDDIRATFDRVARMSADYEKFRTLDGFARTQQLGDELRGAYITAANTIRESRMRDRATASLRRR